MSGPVELCRICLRPARTAAECEHYEALTCEAQCGECMRIICDTCERPGESCKWYGAISVLQRRVRAQEKEIDALNVRPFLLAEGGGGGGGPLTDEEEMRVMAAGYVGKPPVVLDTMARDVLYLLDKLTQARARVAELEAAAEHREEPGGTDG